MNKLFLKIIFILFLVSVVLLPGCGGESGGTDTGNPINSIGPSSQSICETAGGEWIEFEDSCTADLCPEQLSLIDCSSLTESGFDCECGETQCWNGEACEDT